MEKMNDKYKNRRVLKIENLQVGNRVSFENVYSGEIFHGNIEFITENKGHALINKDIKFSKDKNKRWITIQEEMLIQPTDYIIFTW